MANRYWVGGSATWDATAGTKWALTSGGAGGETVPTSADDVFLDSASGGVTVTLSGSPSCKNLNFTGFTGTLNLSANLNVYGSLTLVSGMTLVATSGISFEGSGTGRTATFALKNVGYISMNGLGMGLQFLDTVNCTALSTTGSAAINLNNQVINCTSFSNTSSGTITPGTSSIRVTGSGVFVGGSKTYYEVQLNGTAHTIVGANTFTNLIRTGTATKTDSVTLSANQTITGTLTLTGNSAINRLHVKSDVLGTSRTITAAAVSISNVDFEDIAGAGAASPFTGTSLGDCLGNSNITFPASVDRWWVGASGGYFSENFWAATSGGVAGQTVPLPQDSVYWDGTGSSFFNMDMPRTGNIYYARPGTYGLDGNFSCYGDCIRGTAPCTGNITLRGRGTHIINGSHTNNNSTIIDAVVGTYTASGNLFCGNSFTLISGTFDASTFSIGAESVVISGTATRTLMMGTGLWTIVNPGTVWNASTTTGLTFDKGTADIILSSTTTSARTFAGGGLTYNNLTIGGATGTSTLTFTGSNTFNTISSTKTVAHTIRFTPGTTTTVSDFTVDGTDGNVVTITSAPAATHTLAKAGGGTINVDYAKISYSVATPASTWSASNSTDGGNNTGWSFGGAPPPVTGNNLFFGSNF